MSIQRRFLISDLHLYHRRAVEFRGFASVEEMNEHIVAQWNSVVNKRDTVWVLGDIILNAGYLEEDAKILDRMNGTKNLVLGNHDTSMHKLEVFKNHFKNIMAYKVFGKTKKILLSHIPVSEQQFHRFALNVHGHLHKEELEDRRYVNVSAELTNYVPIQWKEILKRL